MTNQSLLRPAIVLGVMSLIGPFAMDMYLPVMPQIAADLGATAQTVQGTITFYLAAFGAAQLLWGQWRTKWGANHRFTSRLRFLRLGQF